MFNATIFKGAERKLYKKVIDDILQLQSEVFNATIFKGAERKLYKKVIDDILQLQRS